MIDRTVCGLGETRVPSTACASDQGQRIHVVQGGHLSVEFPIENGLRQGCYFAPHIFTVFLMMLVAEMRVGLPEDCGVISKAEVMGSIIPGPHL
jgi:hypothetical protein